MKRLALAAACLATLGAERAWAYSISLTEGNYVVRWFSNRISFQLDADGTSDISNGSDLTAVRAAVQSWNTVACSNLELIESGTTTQTSNIITENRTDGINRVVWVEDSRWEFGPYVLGVTSPVYYNDGEIDEADIVFNGYNTSWSTNGTYTDVESVAVHEFGHFFGLQHVLGGENMSDPPTMSPAVDEYLRTRTLTQDDANGACFLYPASAHQCSAAGDCPRVVDVDNYGEEYYSASSTCSGGQCGGFQTVQPGSTQLGGTCGVNSECVAGLFCQPVYGAGSFCAQDCNPAASDCPCGFDCLGYQDSSGGACLPASQVGCSCDTTTGPDPGCTCDPSCGGSVGACTCDKTTACDANCACDPECEACTCDTTTACDPDCDCDPECDGGCAASPLPGGKHAGSSWIAFVVLIGVFTTVFRNSRR